MTQQELVAQAMMPPQSHEADASVIAELASRGDEGERLASRLLTGEQLAMLGTRYTRIQATTGTEWLVCRLGILAHALWIAMGAHVPWPWLQGFDQEALIRHTRERVSGRLCEVNAPETDLGSAPQGAEGTCAMTSE